MAGTRGARTYRRAGVLNRRGKRDTSLPRSTLDESQSRPPLLLLVAGGAALFWAAAAIGFFVHEVVGHGGAALALGYPLLAFYVSPIEGFAISQTPPTLEGAGQVIFRLAGPAVTVVVGLLALVGIGRDRAAITRTFFLYLGLICLDGTLAYAAADLGLRTGVGDFSVAFAALGLPTVPFAAVAFAGALLIAFLFCRKALGIIEGFWPLTSYRRRVTALCLYFLPGPLLQGAYLAMVSSLMRPEWAMAIALAVVMALVWAVVGSVVAAAGSGRPAERAVVSRASLARVLAVCVPALIVLVGVFGPTSTTARAALLRFPADDWMPKPPITNLDVRVTGDLQVEAIFVLKLVPDAFPSADASVVHRRIFDHLNRQSTAWAYYDTFSTRSVTEMLGVTGRLIDHSMQRLIWFDGRETDNARAVAVSGSLGASTHLRQEPEGYALRIAVWTVDPLDGGRRPLERLRVTAGPGLRLFEGAEGRGERTSPLNVGPTGVVWTRSQHEPPEIVTVRFRRGAAAE